MKIDIREKNGNRIWIPFPTWLGLNRLTVGIAFAYYREKLQETGIDLGYTEVYEYLRQFRKVERRHKGLCIVDVESADGDKVKIYL